jgi:Ca2+-binding RTX toxin-like protein
VAGRRLLLLLGAAVVLAALALPAASLANHVSITATVTARLKERASSRAWTVEVSWQVECVGAAPGSAGYSGNLNLIDIATGERIYMGGVSSGSGKADQLVYAKSTERHMKAELKISCFEYPSLHGAGPIVVSSGASGSGSAFLVIPALGDDGEGHRYRRGGSDPTEPLQDGGCKVALQGTNDPDTLSGGSSGDIIFGYGAGDRLRGGGGHDCVLGGRGNDSLRGDGGDDRLTGGKGGDMLVGGSGSNAYDAGPGNDVVDAVNHRIELVRCGAGKDRARVDRRDRVTSCERVKRVR